MTTTRTVRYESIPSSAEGQRIDNYLIRILKGVPKSHIYRLLRRGEVRINKKRIKPEYRLKLNDELRLPPMHLDETATPPKMISQRWLTLLEEEILYEEPGFLVLNKPAGIPVHGGTEVSTSIIDIMRLLRPDCPEIELAHRLDRDTSGCLVIAKKRSALRQLHALLREGAIEKNYLALVCGRWRGGQKRVNAPLRKYQLQGGERMVRVDHEEGKTAESVFIPERVYENATRVRVQLHTGRTHQIRVHAAHIGHPVVGDEKYGDKQHNHDFRTLGLKRLCLHAYELKFFWSEDRHLVHVQAPLAPDFFALLDEE